MKGDKVVFKNHHQHERQPMWYPAAGTIGTVTYDDDDGVIEVQWAEGSTSENDIWWCDIEDVEKVDQNETD